MQIRRIASLSALSLLLQFACACQESVSREEALDATRLFVRRVVDGDTLELSDLSRVRLIGIDTPETYSGRKLSRDARRSRKDVETIRAMGMRSKEFTNELCLGKGVRLEYDVQRKDHYGRTLAYVYLEDGTFVNAAIIRAGFGQVMTVPPNARHSQLFLKLQNEARDKGSGLWMEG